MNVDCVGIPKTELQVKELLVNKDFVEICHDDKKEIQK
jgi:hypothetical protein